MKFVAFTLNPETHFDWYVRNFEISGVIGPDSIAGAVHFFGLVIGAVVVLLVFLIAAYLEFGVHQQGAEYAFGVDAAFFFYVFVALSTLWFTRQTPNLTNTQRFLRAFSVVLGQQYLLFQSWLSGTDNVLAFCVVVAVPLSFVMKIPKWVVALLIAEALTFLALRAHEIAWCTPGNPFFYVLTREQIPVLTFVWAVLQDYITFVLTALIFAHFSKTIKSKGDLPKTLDFVFRVSPLISTFQLEEAMNLLDGSVNYNETKDSLAHSRLMRVFRDVCTSLQLYRPFFPDAIVETGGDNGLVGTDDEEDATPFTVPIEDARPPAEHPELFALDPSETTEVVAFSRTDSSASLSTTAEERLFDGQIPASPCTPNRIVASPRKESTADLCDSGSFFKRGSMSVLRCTPLVALLSGSTRVSPSTAHHHSASIIASPLSPREGLPLHRTASRLHLVTVLSIEAANRAESFDVTKLSAESTVFLKTVASVVKLTGGTVYNYRDRHVTAFWTRTKQLPHPAIAAMSTFRDVLHELNSTSQGGHMNISGGIDMSQCLLGNVGSSMLLMFHELRGPAVDGALALCTLSQNLSCGVLISDAVHREISDSFVTRHIGYTTCTDVRATLCTLSRYGVRVYEVLDQQKTARASSGRPGYTSAPGSAGSSRSSMASYPELELMQDIDLMEEAVGQYAAGALEEACLSFRVLRERRPRDAVLNFYLNTSDLAGYDT